MIQRLLALVCAVLAGFIVLSPGFADPEADARYIVEQHAIATGSQEALNGKADDMIVSIQSGLEPFGATIVDPEGFKEMMLGDLLVDVQQIIADSGVAVFMDTYTPQELADLAEFYRSPKGRAFLAKDFSSESFSGVMRSYGDGPGWPISEVLPELIARTNNGMSDVMPQIDEVFSEAFSMDRIADILETDGIVAFEDESSRQKVVTALREFD